MLKRFATQTLHIELLKIVPLLFNLLLCSHIHEVQ